MCTYNKVMEDSRTPTGPPNTRRPQISRLNNRFIIRIIQYHSLSFIIHSSFIHHSFIIHLSFIHHSFIIHSSFIAIMSLPAGLPKFIVNILSMPQTKVLLGYAKFTQDQLPKVGVWGVPAVVFAGWMVSSLLSLPPLLQLLSLYHHYHHHYHYHYHHHYHHYHYHHHHHHHRHIIIITKSLSSPYHHHYHHHIIIIIISLSSLSLSSSSL